MRKQPHQHHHQQESFASLYTASASMALEKYDDLASGYVSIQQQQQQQQTTTTTTVRTTATTASPQHPTTATATDTATATATPLHPAAPDLLRPSWYDLQKVSLLGQGVYSNVYLVVDTHTRQQYALKCLDATRLDSPAALVDAATDLARETALLAHFYHQQHHQQQQQQQNYPPNIITLRGISSTGLSESYQEDGPGFFFLMDVLPETLQDRLTRWKADKTNYCSTSTSTSTTTPAAANTTTTAAATTIGRHPRNKNTNHTGKQRKKNRSFFVLSSSSSFFLTMMTKQNNKRTQRNRNRLVDLDRMKGRLETVALGIVRGMRYLHEEQGVVLRDLKPANVGFDDEGVVRLLDFGMARPLQECLSDEVVGTPRFMAPEVMMLQGTSMASDVYSFGVVLYEVCALQVAFSAPPAAAAAPPATAAAGAAASHDNHDRNKNHNKKKKSTKWELEDFQTHVAEDRARPSLQTTIPCLQTQALIADCWAHDPKDRPTFGQIHQRLLEILEDPTSSSSPSSSSSSSSSSGIATRTSEKEAASCTTVPNHHHHQQSSTSGSGSSRSLSMLVRRCSSEWTNKTMVATTSDNSVEEDDLGCFLVDD